jgi:hypothetical protein
VSRHITQGCKIIGNNDLNSSTAAYDAAKSKLMIVTLHRDRERWASYHLSTFSQVVRTVERLDTTALNNRGTGIVPDC